MSRLQALLSEARRVAPEIDASALDRETASLTLIDCREPDEVRTGFIRGAIAVPRGLLETSIENIVKDKRQPVVLYCASGTRSLLAARTLHELGYAAVMSLAGGVQSWKAAGLPLTLPESGTQIDRERYLAQLKLPEIGETGQRRLAAARVLVIGAGGLGSPVSLYLAAAGVGTIGLVDHDFVDRSNLQRQILHTTDRVGVRKVDSAYIALKALNPGVHIERYGERLTPDLAATLFPRHDLVVDGTDNFESRYLINRACHTFGKACVHGSVFRWQGQVAVFGIEGPCYECLFPVPPTGEMAPNCAEGGVVGAITGVIGAAMACEVIKSICGVATGLSGAIATFDLRTMEVGRLRVDKDPGCACCSAPADESFRYTPMQQDTCSLAAGHGDDR